MRRKGFCGVSGWVRRWLAGAVIALGLAAWVENVAAADVRGYSVLKGEFLNQVGPTERELDPDFGFSVLASVDLTDFDLATQARVRLPDGDTLEMDSLGDSWVLLDSYATLEELDVAYVWGDYILLFKTVHDGDYSCLVELPERALPPGALLSNWEDVQGIDTARELELRWEYDAPLRADDFVQVYVNLGHQEVFSTPNLGEPGALDGRVRSVTLPPGVLAPGLVHSLNIEITRLISTNSGCYAGVEGVGGVFRSTSIDLVTVKPPQLRLLSAAAGSAVVVEVLAEPGSTVVLEQSPDLAAWTPVTTNRPALATNVVTLPATPLAGPSPPALYFRARQD